MYCTPSAACAQVKRRTLGARWSKRGRRDAATSALSLSGSGVSAEDGGVAASMLGFGDLTFAGVAMDVVSDQCVIEWPETASERLCVCVADIKCLTVRAHSPAKIRGSPSFDHPPSRAPSNAVDERFMNGKVIQARRLKNLGPTLYLRTCS